MVVFHRDTYAYEISLEENQAHHVIVTREEVEDFVRQTVTLGQVLRRAQLIPEGDWLETAEKAFRGPGNAFIETVILGAARSYTLTPHPDVDPVSFFQSYYFALAPIIDPVQIPLYYPSRAQQALYLNSVENPEQGGSGFATLGANFWIDPKTGEFATVLLRQPIDYEDEGKAQVEIVLTRFNPDGSIASGEIYKTEPDYPCAFKQYSIAYDGQTIYTSYKADDDYMPFQEPEAPVITNPYDGGRHVADWEYDYNPKTGQVVSKLFTYQPGESNSYVSLDGFTHSQPEWFYNPVAYNDTYATAASGITRTFRISPEKAIQGTWELFGDKGKIYRPDINRAVQIYYWNYGTYPTPPEVLAAQDFQIAYIEVMSNYDEGPGSTTKRRYEAHNWVEHFFPRILVYFDWARGKWIHYDLVITADTVGYTQGYLPETPTSSTRTSRSTRGRSPSTTRTASC